MITSPARKPAPAAGLPSLTPASCDAFGVYAIIRDAAEIGSVDVMPAFAASFRAGRDGRPTKLIGRLALAIRQRWPGPDR